MSVIDFNIYIVKKKLLKYFESICFLKIDWWCCKSTEPQMMYFSEIDVLPSVWSTLCFNSVMFI